MPSFKRYYFKKDEVETIANDFKAYGVPFGTDFYRMTNREQNNMILTRLRNSGYKGTKEFYAVAEYIYGPNGYLEKVDEQNREDINAFFEALEAEETPVMRNVEERRAEYNDFNKIIRSFTNYKDTPYLELPEVMTSRQTQRLNEVMKKVLMKFFKTIEPKDLYVIALTTEVSTMEGLEASPEEVVNLYPLNQDFVKTLEQRLNNNDFIKRYNDFGNVVYDNVNDEINVFKVGFSNDTLLEIHNREFLRKIQFVKFNMDTPQDRERVKLWIQGLASAGKITNHKEALIIKALNQYIENSNRYNTRAGQFWQYYLTNVKEPVINECMKCQIFTKSYFDENTKGKKPTGVITDNCLIYALKQWRNEAGETIPEDTLNNLLLFINDCEVKHNEKMRKILLDNGIVLNINYMNDEGYIIETYKNTNKSKAKYNVEVNLFKKHWFLEYKTNLTSSYLEFMLTDNGAKPGYRYDGKRWKKATDNYLLSASKMVRWLMNHQRFLPMTTYDIMKVPSVEVPDVEEIGLTPFDSNLCCKSLNEIKNLRKKKAVDNRTVKDGQPLGAESALPTDAPKKDPLEDYVMMVGDFETITKGNESSLFVHIGKNMRGYKNQAYQLCVRSILDDSIIKTYNGYNCAQQMLNDDTLPNKMIMYFHNLTYDINFLAKFGIQGKAITPNNRIYQARITYKNKVIILKDSLPLFQCKLENIPKMFNLSDLEKDVCPYEYYTKEHLTNGYGMIEEAAAYSKDPEQFINNCINNGFNRGAIKFPSGDSTKDGVKFDMWAYSEYYCQKDVEILAKGLKEMRRLFLDEPFKQDIFKVLTAPGLSANYFNREVFEKNDDIKALAGIPAAFIRKCVHGGRVMSAWGKMWCLYEKIQDFDAVSLYPSAMSIMTIPKGTPKIWNPNVDLSKANHYFVRVEIQPLTTHYPFPLIPYKNGDVLEWTDNFTKPIQVYLTNVALEDIKEFYPEVQYRIIEGLYYDEGVDVSIQEAIKKVFNLRLKYKAEKNPMEQLCKLIMNSCYGKMIQKPITSETYFIKTEDFTANLIKNYNLYEECEVLDESNTFRVKMKKSIIDQFTFAHAGALVLDYSKRIMNRVMCLAYKIGCRIFYQDTDSMHICVDDIEKLQQTFKEKYGTELIGKNMLQFHCDFETKKRAKDENGNSPKNPDDDKYKLEVSHAERTIILGKKMYYDKLVLSSPNKLPHDKYDYHIRMKGISDYAIKTVAGSEDPAAIYEQLYNGDTVEFDLVETHHPKFKIDKHLHVDTLDSFKRKISTNLEKGDIEKYFTY